MLSDGLCLIEWPEMASKLLPKASTILLRLTHEGDGRRAVIEASRRHIERLERVFAISRFLERNGKASATRRYFSGDAAYRTYELVRDDDSQYLLMDWQPQPPGPALHNGKSYSEIVHLARTVEPFVALDLHLRSEGFALPEILARDMDEGILLLSDMGRAGVLDANGAPIEERYIESAACLAALHEKSMPATIDLPDGGRYEIPRFDADAMKIETSLLLDWYLPHMHDGKPTDDAKRQDFFAVWDQLIAKLANVETGLVLRDFHSPNIIWQQDKPAPQQVGIIDFQDAMIGPTAYDLASLVQDARVTIPPELQVQMMERYFDIRRKNPAFDEKVFLKAFAIMAAQRNCKLVGAWVRLLKRDGKPGYMKHMPRTFTYMRAALEHPDLAPLRDWFARAGIDLNSQ
jgi:aminoglycoside/choline kinase family phosphotransferase